MQYAYNIEYHMWGVVRHESGHANKNQIVVTSYVQNQGFVFSGQIHILQFQKPLSNVSSTFVIFKLYSNVVFRFVDVEFRVKVDEKPITSMLVLKPE